MSNNNTVKDPYQDDWEGDPDTLPPLEDLCCDADLCDRIFASKREAFQMGVTLAERHEETSDGGSSARRS